MKKPIVARISSKDVIHSFKIPVMRFTQDAVPGAVIPVWFEATKTGAYDIACAQLCGNSHYFMKGFFNVVKTNEWEEFVMAKSATAASANQSFE